LNGPDRVLAARAGTEVLAGDEDRGARVAFGVQLKRWIGRTVLPVAPVVEEMLAEAGASDGLEELFRESSRLLN